MATTNHEDIVDPYIHEPIGIAAASGFEVYVADGLGSGDWTIPFAFAGIGLNDGDGTDTISSIGTTAQKVTVFDHNTTFYGSTPDYLTDSDITIGANGVYIVTFTTSAATSAAGDAGVYQFRLRVNGSEPSSPNNIGARREFSGTSDTGDLSFTSILTLSTNDVLTVWVESDEAGNTDDLIIYECHLLVQMARRT